VKKSFLINWSAHNKLKLVLPREEFFMSKTKRNFFISLIFVTILFTVFVKIVDVKNIGVNGTSIGFGTINHFVFEIVGVNMIWYYITELLGYVSIFIAFIYVLIGFIQLIKRKSIFKVDREIIVLGLFYIVVIFIYVFFENVIINYRPILMNGTIEPSYPSSHTLMTICICGSCIIINKKLFANKTKIMNILSLFIILITVIGRLISGVHWFTDIIGGVLISSSLLMSLYLIVNMKKSM